MVERLSGFTLIELIIVLLLLGIVSFTIITSWPGLTINLTVQAQQLANDIRYTQSLAMDKGLRYYLIKQSATTYQIMDSAGTPIRLASGSTTVTFNPGITFGALTNLPNNLIAFNGQGIPYTTFTSPGTLLSSTATISLLGGGMNKTLSISPETGRVIIQ